MSFKPQPKGFATQAIHCGQHPEQWSDWGVTPPIVTSTTYQQVSPGVPKQYTYSRYENPTRDVLETCLARLDSGQHALTYSSGMAACMAVTQLLGTGDHLICASDVYGGTYEMLSEMVATNGVQSDFVDMTDLAAVERLIRPNTKLVWCESVTNPLLRIVDIEALVRLLAGRGIILCIDNSYLSSYLLRPLELGVDIVMYSLTKYMNGHSDVTMGALVVRDEELHARLRNLHKITGFAPSPFDCYQVNRSLKTLALRMDRHQHSGLTVARFLQTHPRVERVVHPALETHPEHSLALRQMHGHSGVFAFYVKGGDEETKRFFGGLRMITLAASFGSYHSLVLQAAKMIYGPFTLEKRAEMGITMNMVRLSVGLEDVESIIEDLDQALNQI